MSRVFIVHGSYGNPHENWIPWLSNELKQRGYEVHVPLFPTPEGQSLDTWMAVFEEYASHIETDSILIGHSLGVAFVLRILEKLEHPIHSAYFVSGFCKLLGNPLFDDINKTFIERDFDWEKIRDTCDSFTVFHSNNDPYVPLSFAEELSSHLETPITLVHDAGHFNEKAGYMQFEALLQNIITNS